MAFSPATRQWVHHKDCTWCVFRQEVPVEIKRGKVVKSREVCTRTLVNIPPPYDVNRYCDQYRQINCGCTRCNPVYQTPNGTKD